MIYAKEYDRWTRKTLGPRLNIKIVFPRYWIPVLKIKRWRDRLVFNMGISILVRRHLYIETPPTPTLPSPQDPTPHHPQQCTIWTIYIDDHQCINVAECMKQNLISSGCSYKIYVHILSIICLGWFIGGNKLSQHGAWFHVFFWFTWSATW